MSIAACRVRRSNTLGPPLKVPRPRAAASSVAWPATTFERAGPPTGSCESPGGHRKGPVHVADSPECGAVKRKAPAPPTAIQDDLTENCPKTRAWRTRRAFLPVARDDEDLIGSLAVSLVTALGAGRPLARPSSSWGRGETGAGLERPWSRNFERRTQVSPPHAGHDEVPISKHASQSTRRQAANGKCDSAVLRVWRIGPGCSLLFIERTERGKSMHDGPLTDNFDVSARLCADRVWRHTWNDCIDWTVRITLVKIVPEQSGGRRRARQIARERRKPSRRRMSRWPRRGGRARSWQTTIVFLEQLHCAWLPPNRWISSWTDSMRARAHGEVSGHRKPRRPGPGAGHHAGDGCPWAWTPSSPAIRAASAAPSPAARTRTRRDVTR